jgi:hypothetical protein
MYFASLLIKAFLSVEKKKRKKEKEKGKSFSDGELLHH